MFREFVTFSSLPQSELGAPLHPPIPVVCGFFGFNSSEWNRLNSQFARGSTAEQFTSYMTAVSQEH
jgi:hypothetical protein